MTATPVLKRVTRLDSVPAEKVEYTPEGFLIDNPIVTSVGIFEYHDPDGSVRRELRLPEHVFDGESLATYEGKPVIITHDAGRVSKENVSDEIVGTILSKGYKDGNDVRAKIVIHDIGTVKRSGFRELSLGYDLTLDETPGEWNGQPYDAVQTEIRINHLALVREARAGEQARLNIDGKTNLKGESVMAKPVTKKKAMNADEMKRSIADYEARRKRRLDEAEDPGKANSDDESKVAEEVRDNEEATPAAPAEKPSIEERIGVIKDRRDRRDAEGDPEDPEAAKGFIARQDEDIEQLLEIVEELQAAKDLAQSGKTDAEDEPATDGLEGIGVGGEAGKEGGGTEVVIKTDSIDAIVAERLRLGRLGDKLHLDGLETVKPLEAKKRVIKAIKPDLRLDGKSATYVNTAFDIAVQELNSRKDTDYQRRQMFNRDGNDGDNNGSSQSARERMIERMMNGGKS